MRKMARIFTLGLIGLLLAGTLPAHAQTNSAQRNKKLVQDAIAKISAGNPDGWTQLLTDPFKFNEGDVTLHDASPMEIGGLQQALQAAIPDYKANGDIMVAQNDDVIAFITSSGTFTKPFSFALLGPNPVPPTNKPVQWPVINAFHFNADGKVTELWSINDPTVFGTQLGIMPAQQSNASPLKVKDLTDPVGFKALSAADQAATFTSGMERRNLSLMEKQLQLPIGVTSDADYASPYIARGDGNNPEAMNPGTDPVSAIFMATMPDLKGKPVAELAEGDWTAGIAVFTGTFTGTAQFGNMQLKPTGKTISFPIAFIQRRNADGKIVEEWTQINPSGLFQGLGLGGPGPNATPAQ